MKKKLSEVERVLFCRKTGLAKAGDRTSLVFPELMGPFVPSARVPVRKVPFVTIELGDLDLKVIRNDDLVPMPKILRKIKKSL